MVYDKFKLKKASSQTFKDREIADYTPNPLIVI